MDSRNGTPVQERLYNLTDLRLKEMDDMAIDMEILSINPYWYRKERDVAEAVTNLQNEKLAEWCSAHSDRFVGLASVALQHPEMAADQLDEAVKKMGMKGVGISGHTAGEVPSTSRYGRGGHQGSGSSGM